LEQGDTSLFECYFFERRNKSTVC